MSCVTLYGWQIWTFWLIFKIISTLQTRSCDQLVSDLYLVKKTFSMLLSLYESQLTNCECDHFPTLLERTTSDPKAEIKSRIGKCVTVIKISEG